MKTNRLKISRLILFFTFVVAAFLILTGRFFQLQVIQGREYSLKFQNQCWLNQPIEARRGTIFDRHGKPLAYSIESEDLYVNTESEDLIRQIAFLAAPILNTSSSAVYTKLAKRIGKRTCLAKKIDPVTSGRLRALQIEGLQSEVLMDRTYPYNSSAAALLGYLNHESQPVAGVELYCDEYLRGRDGMRTYIKDGSGGLYPVNSQPMISPLMGNNVYLTIDIEYQQILQEEIRAAVDKWEALGGMGVLLEVATGKILAAYHYDPAQTDPHYKYPKAKAITDLFEPGSTFKTVVFAALLEEHKLDLKEQIYAGEGVFQFSGVPLKDDKKLKYITEAEAFILSSNIATGRLALRLGPKKLYRYAREIGFGLSTGLNFPGENSGSLQEPAKWNDYYCAMLSIGHCVSASTLQMARMFECVANDGMLMRPLLIERVVSPAGGTLQRFYPECERRIFSEATARTLQSLCALVVDTGTAKYARQEGISFAGKTGTAEKPAATGGYDKSKYIASFGGYFPAEDPEICGIIVIDEPRKVHYGGITAGPAFANVAKRITNLEEHRKDSIEKPIYTALELLQDSSEASEDQISDSGLENDTALLTSDPGGDSAISAPPDSTWIRLPDLKGSPARKAVSTLYALGLKCSLEGAGQVITTIPGAGSYAQNGQEIKLICRRAEREVSH